MTKSLETVETPALVLSIDRFKRNVEGLKSKLNGQGVSFRPHLKTVKSIELAREMMSSASGPAAVSTLKEAEMFVSNGVKDIIYAVGISPTKFPRILDLMDRGADVCVLLDSPEQALEVSRLSQVTGHVIPALIEIDCDGHRSGVRPNDKEKLVKIARILNDGGAELRGVLTHAGESYSAKNSHELEACAENERDSVTEASASLRNAGFKIPVVSVGSTPTAHFAKDLTGVTEVRAGVFAFFDLFMAGLGVCKIGDIAVSVLATVIGHQEEKGWTIVDAGWMALSPDRGTSRQRIDQGFGVVCDVNGNPYDDLILSDANQEHGIVRLRPNSDKKAPHLEIGSRVRILPNHACATCAQHERYLVVTEGDKSVKRSIPRFGGW